MPTSDGQQYGFKYVTGHRSNTRRDPQTVTAFRVAADVATGYPVLVSEMIILTALRDAAISAKRRTLRFDSDTANPAWRRRREFFAEHLA